MDKVGYRGDIHVLNKNHETGNIILSVLAQLTEQQTKYFKCMGS